MQTSPLDSFHVDNGAQMVEYAGWRLPMKYSGIIEEHRQVRASGGIFDVSHMGRLEIGGLHARRLLERVCTRKISGMQPGRCRYTLICNERGGVKDDALVYRLDEDEYLMVCNGANREKIVRHIGGVIAERGLKAKLTDKTAKTAMVAVQGPRVMELIAGVSREVPSLKRFQFVVKNVLVMKLIVSRTGYTGEDGVEVILPAGAVGMAMKLLLKDVDVKAPGAVIRPAGLGARDTLRIEAAMPLFGHELDEDADALSSGLDFAIALDKNEEEHGETFIGQEALVRTRDNGGPTRRLAGLELEGRRTARQGMTVFAGDAEAGVVTSGCLSPTLDRSIAMAFVDVARGEPGTELAVDFGTRRITARVVPLPFYKPPA